MIDEPDFGNADGHVHNQLDSESVRPEANNRSNVFIVAVIGTALLIAGGIYLFWASGRVDSDIADRQARALDAVEEFEATQPTSTQVPKTPTVVPEPSGPVQPVAAAGEVVFVNRIPGDDYGRLGIRHSDGTRTLLDQRCLRVHIAAGNGVCLSQDDALVPAYTTTFFQADDPYQSELKSYASALPSRARISPDGSLSSVTAFISGTSYADISGETSTIVTIDKIESREQLRGANQFEVLSNVQKYNDPTSEYWGLTFADNDEIYITGFFGEAPEIMHGSLDAMTVKPTGYDGSCPSLSPDGETLVYKASRDDGGFDLVAVDLASDTTWQLGETRSVDDQVEWLDNDTILYALHPDGGDTPTQPEFDIWVLDIAEGSEPELFLPNADSPAAIR